MGSPRDDGFRSAGRAVGVAAALITGALFCLLLTLFVSSMSGDIRERAAARSAVYSAAVTEAALRNAHWVQDRVRVAYDPVVDLTVHVKVPGGGKADVCLGGHSVAAVVSYGDAFLGEGSVPRLCVKPLQEGRVAVTAWGMDVKIPEFLKKRLDREMKRGEAEVDVAVPMSGGEVLVCKATIGGDLSPCTLEAASTN